MVSFPICEHIKKDGVRCGSPARRGRKFCHFHQHWRDTHPRFYVAGLPGRKRRPSTPAPLDQFARDLARQWFRHMASFSNDKT
jgi:hypothetical protein